MTRILIPRSDNSSAKTIEASDFEKYHGQPELYDYVICGLCASAQCPNVLAVDIAIGNAKVLGLHLNNSVSCSVTCLTACATNKIYATVCRDPSCEPEAWTLGATTGCIPIDSYQIGSATTNACSVTAVCNTVAARKTNNQFSFVGTATEIAALCPTFEGQKVFVTEEDACFSFGRTYTRNIGNTAWLLDGDVSQIVMAHSTSICDYTTPCSATGTTEEDPVDTVSECFCNGCSFTQCGTDINVDCSVAGKLSLDDVVASSNHYAYKPLHGTVSDSCFVLEVDIIVNDSTVNGSEGIPFYLSAGTTSPWGGCNDFIGIDLQTWTSSGGEHRYGIRYKEGACGGVKSGNTTFRTNDTQQWLRLSRTSTTSVTLDIYSDACRSCLQDTITVCTLPAAVGGLQYFGAATEGSGISRTVAELDNMTLTNVTLCTAAANVYDDCTNSRWQSCASTNPAIYVDAGSCKNITGLALYTHSATTETEIQLRVSTDATFTCAEKTRTITVTCITAGQWNYIRFNAAIGRYIQVYGNSGSSVKLAINEIKYKSNTDSELILSHGHLLIDPASTSYSLKG